MNKKAFTLVELIVVITILAILATIGFVSLQGYTANARDSVRVTDIQSIEKILEIYSLDKDKYPTPVNPVTITYSGSTAWTQGEFGSTAFSNSASMTDVPVDPITGLAYAYSITAGKEEYQLGGVLENLSSSINPVSITYAGEQQAQAYIKGNFNGSVIKVKTPNTSYLLGVPSIMTSNISNLDLESILLSGSLVYSGYNNLPASFSGSVYDVEGGFDFGKGSYVTTRLKLFEGDIDDFETSSSVKTIFFRNLQVAYAGSIISGKSGISDILAISKRGGATASNFVASALNKNFETKIAFVEDKAICPSNPSPEGDFTFDIPSQSITGYVGSDTDIVIPCQIGGIDVIDIGYEAFRDDSLTSVILPGTILFLRTRAFAYNNLTSIDFPDSITLLETSVFRNNFFTTITFPESLEINHGSSFGSNGLITSVYYLGSTSPIGRYNFIDANVDTVIFPESVDVINEWSFEGNNLTNVIIPDSVTEIQRYAFRENLLTSIVIPASVTEIGAEAFENNQLTSASITIICPTPTSIDASAFNNNAESIILPACTNY